MTTVFDQLKITESAGVTTAPDPRVSEDIAKAVGIPARIKRNAFHQMADELESDGFPLLPGMVRRVPFLGPELEKQKADDLKPLISDAIADIIASDPKRREDLERGEPRAQAQAARSTISRMVSAGNRFEPRHFISAFKEEVGKRVVDPTVGEKVGEFGQRVMAGATAVIATGESGAASIFDNASKKVPGPIGDYFTWVSEGLDLRAAQVLSDIQKDYAGDPRLESEAFWSTFPETIGSFGGFVAISSVTGGMAGGTVLAGAVGIGESRQRRQYAVSQGILSPKEGVEAELLGAIPGILQVVPLFHALKGFGGKSAAGLIRGIGQTVAEGVVVGLEESIVETIGELGQDAIEKWQFDPSKVIGENAIETAKISGAGGVVVGLVTSAIRGARLGRYRKRPGVEAEGFTQDDAKRIIDDGVALEQAAQTHIDEAKKAADPSRQALEFLRVNTSNVEFVKRGKRQIVDELMERFGLSKRRARRVYLRVKEGYDLVRLSEQAGQPVEVIKQAQDLVNESLNLPTDPDTPITAPDGDDVALRNTFAQSVREDLYREFRSELTELDVEQEPLGQALPRGVPARFFVSETTGETLPIPLSPFPVVVRGEIGQLGLREHRESVSFRNQRDMDLFEANTLAELLQEANPDDAFAVFKAGEDDWRVYSKRAETTTLTEPVVAPAEEAEAVAAVEPEAEPEAEVEAEPVAEVAPVVEPEVPRAPIEPEVPTEVISQKAIEPVPFDDALTEAPPGLEFTGSAMPEGDLRGNLLQAFQEDPNEARLFAEAVGITNVANKTPEQIIDEFMDTRKAALESPDEPHIQMLYSGIPIPDHLPQLILKGVSEHVRPVVNIAAFDLIDRLRRASDDPLIQDAAASARLASLDAKAIIGEMSPMLDPLLRMAGKHPLTAEGKAVRRLQQIQWDDNGDGGVSLFHLALEDKLPPGVTLSETEQLIIDRGKDLIAFGGRLHEREGTLRFNQRTQEWEPFQQTGRAVAPRISTLELFDVIARGEGDRFESLVRLIAENPDNIAVIGDDTEQKVRKILLEQRDDMLGLQGEPSAFRRINAEFMRIWPYFPTIIKDAVTGARVQLIENNPFHYFERYAKLTAGRLSFVRHFGQETEAPSLINKLVDIVQNKRSGSDEVIAVTRALHGLPVERTFWTTPGSAPHQTGIALRHASSILKAGSLSMTWPQNLLEFLGRILGIAGGPAKRDFWVAMGNLYARGGERRAASISALRSLGAVDNWIRNLSFDPNRPAETATRILREAPTLLVRVFWKEQSRLAAAIGLEKANRMAAGRGTDSDVIDVQNMLGLEEIQAEAMKRGEGTPEQYLMIARRAGAYTTNQPMVPAEQSRLEHSRVFRTMFAFTTYAFMGIRWLAANIRTTMPIMQDLWRNPKSKTAWNRARVNAMKLGGQALGLTAAGAGSYFLLALATGGLHGLKLAWKEASEDPMEFLLDSFLYTTFAGPFGSLLRLTQNQSRNRFESIVRMTWPGAIAIELTDFLGGTGRYRDREFFGRDGKLMRLTDRFVPINRMIWQGLAVVGIGADQQELRTTIRAYWRARQEITPFSRTITGEPEVEELQEAFEGNRQFRIKMRLAHEAMLRGDNPQEFINDAFGADLTKKPSDAARAIRRFKLLTGKFKDEGSIEFNALRSRIGDDAIMILRQHDQLLESTAASISPPKGRTINYRPVPQRTLNGAANQFRR